MGERLLIHDDVLVEPSQPDYARRDRLKPVTHLHAPQAAVVLIAAALVALAGVSAAAAATPAQNAAFAKQLKGDIKPVFAKQAPGLALGKVTCTLPASGTVVHCIAHFNDPAAQANVVYGIKATLKNSGALTWTTTTHYCTSAIFHKKIAC